MSDLLPEVPEDQRGPANCRYAPNGDVEIAGMVVCSVMRWPHCVGARICGDWEESDASRDARAARAALAAIAKARDDAVARAEEAEAALAAVTKERDEALAQLAGARPRDWRTEAEAGYEAARKALAELGAVTRERDEAVYLLEDLIAEADQLLQCVPRSAARQAMEMTLYAARKRLAALSAAKEGK